MEGRNMATQRATWKGTISFGLVSVPCRLHLATEEHAVKFNQLHESCGHRINMKKWCSTCDAEATSIVKGYDNGEKFVVLSDADFDGLPLGSKKVVQVVQFVDPGTIPAAAFGKTYYVAPEDFGEKGYALLTEAMKATGKVAIGKIAFRGGREHLVVLRPEAWGMTLETLFWADEVRERPEIHKTSVSKEELEMAKMLVESMVGEYDPYEFTDEYREALMETIEARAAGKTLKTKKVAEAPPVSDIMAALQASLPKKVAATKKRKAS